MKLPRWLRAMRAPRAPVVSRWVVVDSETSGLDPASDRLLAIAAVAVHVDWASRRLSVVPSDSFETVVGQAVASSRENIVLHGIGGQRQRGGVRAAEALQAFTDYTSTSPLLAFHAAFDQAFIEREARQALGTEPPWEWLDVAHLCASAYPQVRAESLDDWLTHFNIGCTSRHDPAADALATADLLLRAWPAAARECRTWREVTRYAARHRWLGRMG